MNAGINVTHGHHDDGELWIVCGFDQDAAYSHALDIKNRQPVMCTPVIDDGRLCIETGQWVYRVRTYWKDDEAGCA